MTQQEKNERLEVLRGRLRNVIHSECNTNCCTNCGLKHDDGCAATDLNNEIMDIEIYGSHQD